MDPLSDKAVEQEPLAAANSADGGETPHEQPPAANLSEDRGVVKAAGILAVGNVTSRVLGLAREIVKANLFGASGKLAAFEAAALVPTALFDLLIGGIVSSALVPVFSDYAGEKERRAELWTAVSAVLSTVIAFLLLVVLLVELFTPQVAWLVGAHEFEEPGLTELSVQLMRLTTPAVLFLSLSSVLTGVLFTLKRFTLPAFTAAVFNGSIVVVALLRPEISSLAWGLLLGSVLQVVVQLPALRDARLRPQLNWRHPALRRILRLYMPILAGLVVDQFARALSYNLAIRTGDESLTYMRWATTLIQFPLGLVVTALSLAILPTLSQQANGRLPEFKKTLAGGIRLVLALILPATAGLLALAVPIVGLLFEHGRFTSADTAMTALVLRVYLLGLPFAAVDQMLVFASYARKDTWRPAVVGVVSIVVYSLTAVLLLEQLGLLSLMVADALKHVVHTAIMLWLLQRHLGGLPGQRVVGTAVKATAAAAVTGLAAFAVAALLPATPALGGFVRELLIVTLGSAAGIVTYILMARWLHIPEAAALLRLLTQRLRR